MKLFPAIDIYGGRAVRLLRGQKDALTDYGDPVDRAKMWRDAGARRLHVVDLSGAFGEESGFGRLLEKIASLGLPVQSGGGLRTGEDISRRFQSGAQYAVLGTVCVTDPALFEESLAIYGEKIVAGLDAKGGKLAVKGWTSLSDIGALDFGKSAFALGARYAVYTDIGRDGALSGVNLSETVKMGETGLNIIASGGIRDETDLAALRSAGVYGAILGRSIYTGTLDLRHALEEFEC